MSRGCSDSCQWDYYYYYYHYCLLVVVVVSNRKAMLSDTLQRHLGGHRRRANVHLVYSQMVVVTPTMTPLCVFICKATDNKLQAINTYIYVYELYECLYRLWMAVKVNMVAKCFVRKFSIILVSHWANTNMSAVAIKRYYLPKYKRQQNIMSENEGRSCARERERERESRPGRKASTDVRVCACVCTRARNPAKMVHIDLDCVHGDEEKR